MNVRADPPLDYADVGHCHTLLLGALPRKLPLPRAGLKELVADLLASVEFRTEVLRPVMLREPFNRGRFTEPPPLALIHWAQMRLPLHASTRVHLGLARSWHKVLEVLLADHGLVALAPELVEAGITATLAERIARDPEFEPQHAIVGAIDSASAFEVRGWALDACHPEVPLTVEIYVDGIFMGAAQCDQPRPDVADVVGGAGQVGFVFPISAAHRKGFGGGCKLQVRDTLLQQAIGEAVEVHSDATHAWDTVAAARQELQRLRVALERIEHALPDLSRMASLPLDAYDEYWRRFYHLAPDLLAAQTRTSAAFAERPLISVVIPAYRSNLRLLEQAIRSVRAQSYDHWELVISDDASPDPSALEVLVRRHAAEPRVRWVRNAVQGGIAANTNAAIAACQGAYVAFLDHDDLLAPEALYRVVEVLQTQAFDWLYSDEDRIEEDASGLALHHSPFFKPDFDHDLLLGMNYICHLVVVRRALLATVGGLRSGFEGAQDHDLLLRLARHAQPAAIVHLPRVLYHWRVTPGSVSQDLERQEALRKTIAAAVDLHLRERGEDAMVQVHEDPVGRARLFANRIRWRLPTPAPRVSIIIPTRDRLDLLRPCVESVLASTAHYPGEVDVMIVDNQSEVPETHAWFATIGRDPRVRIVEHVGGFNYSAINNAAAVKAQGSVLVFLNNDTLVVTPDWLRELVSQALRPEVGAVGARLLYQDGTLQHAGVLLGVEGVAGHEGIGESPLDGGYFGRSQLLHSAAAVTAACLTIRRDLFLSLDGGFDELDLQVAFNDVDLCMRVRAAGFRVVYTPFATLYHFESKSRGREITPAQQARHRLESQAFRKRWGDPVALDPYYNPHFERYARPFARLRPPPEPSGGG